MAAIGTYTDVSRRCTIPSAPEGSAEAPGAARHVAGSRTVVMEKCEIGWLSRRDGHYGTSLRRRLRRCKRPEPTSRSSAEAVPMRIDKTEMIADQSILAVRDFLRRMGDKGFTDLEIAHRFKVSQSGAAEILRELRARSWVEPCEAHQPGW